MGPGESESFLLDDSNPLLTVISSLKFCALKRGETSAYEQINNSKTSRSEVSCLHKDCHRLFLFDYFLRAFLWIIRQVKRWDEIRKCCKPHLNSTAQCVKVLTARSFIQRVTVLIKIKYFNSAIQFVVNETLQLSSICATVLYWPFKRKHCAMFIYY